MRAENKNVMFRGAAEAQLVPLDKETTYCESHIPERLFRTQKKIQRF